MRERRIRERLELPQAIGVLDAIPHRPDCALIGDTVEPNRFVRWADTAAALTAKARGDPIPALADRLAAPSDGLEPLTPSYHALSRAAAGKSKQRFAGILRLSIGRAF